MHVKIKIKIPAPPPIGTKTQRRVHRIERQRVSGASHRREGKRGETYIIIPPGKAVPPEQTHCLVRAFTKKRAGAAERNEEEGRRGPRARILIFFKFVGERKWIDECARVRKKFNSFLVRSKRTKCFLCCLLWHRLEGHDKFAHVSFAGGGPRPGDCSQCACSEPIIRYDIRTAGVCHLVAAAWPAVSYAQKEGNAGG
jgi:hypothetical protein